MSVAVFQYWGKSQYRVTAATAAPDDGWTQTQWGPLGPADRDLLIKVRQAGLWEQPTGRHAWRQATNPRVREVGRLIATEHADLDAKVREVSARLGVALPDQPSTQQQDWITEITTQTGPELDRVFVQRLRAAHGKVLPIISQVRAGTRNDLVRRFTTAAAQYVTRHHEYLENTGLVDYTALPEPPLPTTAPPAAAVDHSRHLNQVASVTPVDGGPVMIAALVYSAALLAIIGLLSLLGTSAFRARRARPVLQHSVAQPTRSRHAAQRW
ncbi:MAG: DUF4142 domain-containing protein [Pseudonocardiaceae bacterium]